MSLPFHWFSLKKLPEVDAKTAPIHFNLYLSMDLFKPPAAAGAEFILLMEPERRQYLLATMHGCDFSLVLWSSSKDNHKMIQFFKVTIHSYDVTCISNFLILRTGMNTIIPVILYLLHLDWWVDMVCGLHTMATTHELHDLKETENIP
jgi:hypothetical protein